MTDDCAFGADDIKLPADVQKSTFSDDRNTLNILCTIDAHGSPSVGDPTAQAMNLGVFGIDPNQFKAAGGLALDRVYDELINSFREMALQLKSVQHSNVGHHRDRGMPDGQEQIPKSYFYPGSPIRDSLGLNSHSQLYFTGVRARQYRPGKGSKNAPADHRQGSYPTRQK